MPPRAPSRFVTNQGPKERNNVAFVYLIDVQQMVRSKRLPESKIDFTAVAPE
jgi:hypothetical protein